MPEQQGASSRSRRWQDMQDKLDGLRLLQILVKICSAFGFGSSAGSGIHAPDEFGHIAILGILLAGRYPPVPGF